MSSIVQESDRNFEADSLGILFFLLFAAAEWMAVSASRGGVFVFSGENGGASGPTAFGPPNL